MVAIDLKPKSHRKHDRGFALIFAIAATALISAAVLLAGNHLQLRYHNHKTELRDVKLIATCDAAMAETLARIAADEAFTGIKQRRFDDSVIESSATWEADGAFVIIAKSQRGPWLSKIVAGGHLTPEGPLVDHWNRNTIAN